MTATPARAVATGRRASPTLRLMVEVSLAALAAGASGLAWLAVFPGQDIVGPVAGATAGALALTVITLLLRLPGPLAALLQLPVAAVAMRLLVGGDVSQLTTGALRGWARVLDSTLPVGPSPDQRVIVPVATWLVVAVTCGLVARTRRAWAHLWPPVALLTVVRLLATRGTAGSVLPSAIGVVAAASVLAVLRTQRDGWAGLRRLGPSALAVVAGGFVGAALIPGATPFDLAARRHPARDDPPPVTSPLALLKSAQQDASTVFTVATAPRGAVPPDLGSIYLRLTVLDGYRAGDWVPTGSFQATGGRVPLPPAEAPAGFEIEQRLTIDRLEGPWVPVADRPVEVTRSPRPVQVDPVTGSIAIRDGVRPGDRFVIRSMVARGDQDALLGSHGDPASSAFARVIPGTPPGLVTLAREWTDGTVSDFDRVAALQGHFAATFAVGDQADSGRSLSQLERFVAVTQVGTSEQFATAFVAMARAVGLPARVGVGFRVPLGVTTPVAAKQLEAWPEVALADEQGHPLGWVPFNPAPKDTRPRDRQVPRPDEGAAAKLAAKVATKQAAVPPPTATIPQANDRRSPWARRVAALLGVLLLVGAAVPLLVAAGRRARTSARRRGTAAARVAGAWTESLQALGVRGLDDQKTSTVTEAVHATAGLAGVGPTASEHLASIGGLLTRALFADAGPVSDVEADAAWASASAIRQLARRDNDRLARLRAAYDVRALIDR